MPNDLDPLLSINAAAEMLGINASTLSRQIQAGQIRAHDGRVRLSEALEDRARHVDLTRSGRRLGNLDADEHATPEATATPAEPVLLDGQLLPFKEARALKESYLAALRRLEFQLKSGELVAVEEVGRQVEGVFAVVRERLLTMPGKLAAHFSHEQVAVIEAEVNDALEELSAPALGADVSAFLGRKHGDRQ